MSAPAHAQEAEYPTDLTVVPAGNGKVTLSWTTPGDGGSPITKHQYRRQYEGTNIWVDIPNSAANGTNANSYTVSGLTNGTRYYFYVRAWSAIGSSGLSNFAWGNAGSVPPAPTNFMVEPGDAQVSFTWTTPGDGGNPIIYHMLRHNVDGAGYGSWALIPDSAPGETNANSYTKLNVLNLTFASQVLAVNSTGRGEPSSEVTVTVVSTDATLSNLSLSDGTLTPAFASGTTSYTASVGNAVSQITVTPTKSDRDASVEYLDASDATITDADGTATGQQVDLDVGANTIKVKVTATDAMTTETYTVTVTRAPPPGPPTVSIAANTQGVREGEAAAFTLSRTGSAAAALMVSVSVEQEGDFISGAKPTSVTFGAGDAAVALEIATVNDEVGEDNGSITVTVTSVPSGTEISQTAASATLVVADKDDTWATVSVDQAAVTVKESAGTVTLGFSARMEPNVTPFSMEVSASTLFGTARFDEDYVSITDEVTFAAADFQMESGRLVAHKTLDVTILNNHAGRWEGDETFTFKVERSPTLPGSVIFVDQDGDKVSNVTTTITITDDEAPPSLELSVAPSFVEEGDTATVKVTSANGSAFAEDQTIDLSFSGIAARGADYTVGDDALTLGAGLTEVTTTVMVLDDSIDDDAGETIVIEAAHAGTSFSQTYTLVIGGLAPPTMLPVTPGDGRVKVCFDEVGATGYTVQWRSASQAFRIARQKTVFETSETRDCGPGTVSTAIRDLDNGTTYSFRAQSTREWWDDKKGRQSEVSDWSDEVSGTPTAGPTPPSNVVLTPGNQQLKVDWDPVAGADDYSVEWRQDGYFRELDTTTNSATITGLQNGRAYGVRVLAENVSGRSAWSAVVRGAPGQPTATFRNVPAAHDGQNAVRFQVGFSHEMGSGEQSLRDDSFTVNDGDVTETRRVDGSNTLWEVTVQPDSREEMTILLPGRDCGETGAVCTDEDTPRPLTNSPLATVEGPSAEPLTASFSGVPGDHTGESFTFGLMFSEDVAGLRYTTLRDSAFSVTNGQVTRARRQTQGTNQGWTITVEPDSHAAVTVRLPAGAVETADGRGLESAVSATVAGPVGIAVANARVDEGADAVLAFAVTLSRAASRVVTVDYATADGSAHAGDDYTAASGTLTFQTGESSQTIEVTVLDDAHDEGEETLTLTLSNAAGGRLTDGEATGTIKNRDPLPRALLARFGRTAAVHVVEHVEARIAAPRAPGVEGRFAGRELRRGMEREMALNFLSQLGSASGVHPVGMGSHGPMAGSRAAGATPLGTPGLGGGGALMMGAGGPLAGAVGMAGGTASLEMPGLGAAGFGGGAPMAAGPMDGPSRPAGGLNGGGLVRMGLGGGDLLTGSAFAMNRESHGGILSFWSRGAQSRFAGREGALSLGGDVRTTMVGADYAKGPVVAGLSLSHSRGLGEYAGVAGGQVASSVTGLYPWLGYKATDRITVWGVAGYGAGGLRLTPQGGPALEAGLSMAMAAAGTRGELVAGGAGGFALAFKADALWVGTATDGVDGPAGRLAATEAAVTRFRTGLEGSRAYTLAGRLSLTPSVEVGLRHDGGDAETGAGMDVGGGLVVSDASTGLAVDLRVRMLVMHQAEGFRERGMAVSLSYNPTPSTPLGFVARVAPSWGGEATGGAEALWGRETMAGMAHGGLAQGNRFDGEVGYGLPVGSRLVGTPRVGFSTSEYGRDYRVGYGLGVLDRESLNVELGVDAQRRESPMLGGTSNGVLGQASLGW